MPDFWRFVAVVGGVLVAVVFYCVGYVASLWVDDRG